MQAPDDIDPLGLVCPNGHAEHAVAAAAEYVPAPHAKHAAVVEPPLGLYEPAAQANAGGVTHAVAEDEPAGETRPLEHAVHADAPPVEYVLAAHVEHAVAPAAENDPAPHAAHAAAVGPPPPL